MTETKTPLLTQIKSYPPQFWVANTMEIFERMSWYGWYTVMGLYVTGSKETGGLGFSEVDRGALQAIVPFFLYILPVFTGAIADRYGYKRCFTIAYLVMIAAYYLLGQFSSFPTFFLAFMFVAVGAAIFKPVVVGTIAKVTNDSNSATGFGIFYMMVNIGGFVGPVVAGIVRGGGWNWVFVACSGWAMLNLLMVTIFYREPHAEASQRKRTFRQVLDGMVEVLGNLRFFITVFVLLFALMFANLRVGWFQYFTWTVFFVFAPVWLAVNFVYDATLPERPGEEAAVHAAPRRNPLRQRMHCSNWRFALFLLIMSGFWTSFNQIFITMPQYIRDYVDTRPMISAVEKVFGASDANDPDAGPAAGWATINTEERQEILKLVAPLSAAAPTQLAPSALVGDCEKLLASKVRISPAELARLATANRGDAEKLTNQVIITSRQVNPEFIVNIDSGAIVLLQVLISFLMAKFHRFTTMITGMVIAAVGIGLSAFDGTAGMVGAGGSVWVVALGLVVFAIGEMMASPTSQEYVGRIAPPDKKALYMGYYFVAVALGNLFGGILSGEMYQYFAVDSRRPDIMWLIFGGIMLLTAIVFLLYDKFALPRSRVGSMTDA